MGTNKIDWMPFVIMLALLCIGTMMIFSTSSVVGITSFNDGYFFIKGHIVFLLLGFLFFLFGLKVIIMLLKNIIGV